ncbi:PIG-L deacetylase family protein [Actinopolyspora xinjiangensis]|uniref:PIG-L deacetylase family protein n=1 Tax=Actinopolyspora xinjiangensis TaxID=405564 RepID=UPI000B88F83D|nr:PIG-L deacetylase family protein [Actinopolyspora xinjiangensis]
MIDSPNSPGTAPERALVVTAHPDDVDFGMAGTVAHWTAAGTSVTYCVCTSGEAGAPEDAPRERVRRLRAAEQRRAAARVGVDDVRFLNHEDGRVSADLALRRQITRVIRSVRPEIVATHSPEINWSRIALAHPDHRAVGEATLAAVYPDARNPFAHPELLDREGLHPWTVRQLWITEAAERVNHAVDVTERIADKLAALSEHASQGADSAESSEAMREHLRGNALRHGLAKGRMAEVFQVVDTE